jgi:hypothetical protein
MLRRTWQIVRAVVLIVVATAALLVGGAWTFLQTPWGGDAVRRLLLPRVNGQIAGRLDLARLAFGGDSITLEGAELRDPAGALVARVDRIEVGFSPLALLRRHVDVRRLEIDGPRLWMVARSGGSNLSRALAPRARPAPPRGAPASSRAGGGDWVVDLRQLAIDEGAFTYGGPKGPRQVHVADLSARARLRLAQSLLFVDLATNARGAHVTVKGTVDLATMRARDPGLVVRGEGIVLAELFAAGPPSDFGFELRAEGGGASLSDLDGHLKLTLPRGRIDGQTLGPVGFVVTAARGRYELADLKAALPGLWVSGGAIATAAHVDAHLRVDARDLAATARALAPRHGPPPIAMAGSGYVDLALTGPIPDPSLRVTGRFPTLRIDANQIDELSLSAVIPNLTRPTRATAQVAAASATVGDQRLRTVALRLDAAGRDLSAEARVAAPYPLSVTAAGRRGGDDRELTLRSLALRYPEATWTLARPARLAFDEGRLLIRDVALASGRQRIAIDLTKTSRGTEGHVVIAAVDLARLPRALVPGALGLAGELELDARVDDRAPRLDLQLALRRLIFKKRAIGDVHLAVAGEGRKPLTASLEATRIAGAAGGKASFALSTPLSLRTLLHRPPTADRLLRTPVDLKGDVDRLPLQTVALLVGHKETVAGTVSSHLEVSGSAANPKGSLALDIAGAARPPRFPPTDARVEVELGDAIDARVRIVRKQRALLALVAHLDAGVAALREPERLAAAPIRLRAVVGPLALQRLGLPASERQPPRVLKGKVHADLSLDGSLREPRLSAHVQASDCRLDKSLVGAAELAVNYAAHKLDADARLTTVNGGRLHLAARTTADLGYPAVTAGLDVRRLPLEVDLDAKDFDLQGLSGATPQLRSVAGLLSAAATARGTIDDPRINGQLEWKKGHVAITGFGEYDDVHLALHGDEKRLQLDELAAKSGHGHARVTGDARPGGQGKKGYEVTAKAQVSRFPIYQEGQPLADVTVDAKLAGRASPFDTQLAIDLDQARIELSNNKRKDLQSLAMPPDIVLVEGGAPLNKAQAEKLQRLQPDGAGRKPAAPTAGKPASPARLRVTVDAPRRLWVTGKDANLELGLEPGFKIIVAGETRIIGTVTIHRGRVDVFGRRFDLKGDSTVKFDGPPDFPELDVTAQYKNIPENVTVLLRVTGTPTQMSVKVSSPDRPELTESQIYTLIITGHLQTGSNTTGSTTPSAQAASLLGGLLASQLQSALSHRLPLDVLTIDAGTEGVTGTQLEAGRYVTDRFYVGYIGRIGADPNRYQNRNAVHLEYQLTARWELEGEYGDVGTGSADLMWKKSY